ncbi:FMN-binding negative transcriptional regulator [Sulfitobacter albidus]|uniref:FMN-binding negative transcriptional regulator n=1 Tax=Sulfitobacter albidus TaxID=2829501 RepID=A0A975JCP8_9RHOB|nr:FMN-binding negative transcriptional regulator [Sulfitobacter albidus]QUJ76057.1 FMN-binding negative transcriptional regulator [Sulfitobacter albidus]
MHPNPVFHDAETARNVAFARLRGFGTLVVGQEGPPLVSHVPFALDAEGAVADIHLVRSNPIARLSETVPARIAVTGGDSYVSPDWYGVADQVPTWNYIAVELTGTLTRLPQDEMRAMLDRQSAWYEAQLAPKPAWTTDKMTPEVLERMMRQIVPIRFDVTGIDGTWKLGQNKPDDVRARAADEMAANGFGTEVAALARAMRDLDHR